MAAGEQSGDLAQIWRKDGIESGSKNGREARMGTWPLGFELLSFCYDCLRCDDFNVLRFWGGRPSPFTLTFDNSALINLKPPGKNCAGYTPRAFLRERFLALEGEGITWMGQPSRQGSALFSARIELWRAQEITSYQPTSAY